MRYAVFIAGKPSLKAQQMCSSACIVRLSISLCQSPASTPKGLCEKHSFRSSVSTVHLHYRPQYDHRIQDTCPGSKGQSLQSMNDRIEDCNRINESKVNKVVPLPQPGFEHPSTHFAGQDCQARYIGTKFARRQGWNGAVRIGCGRLRRQVGIRKAGRDKRMGLR